MSWSQAVLLSRGTLRYYGRAKDRAVPLSHHHPRGGIFPLALSPTGGNATINVSNTAGCSSLAPFNPKTTQGRQCFTEGGPAGGAFEARRVPTLTLDEAFELLPPGLPVERLKIDAEGLDFRLLQTASPTLFERVRSIELEVIKHGCTELHVGQATDVDVDQLLAARGFRKSRGILWFGHAKCMGVAFYTKRDDSTSEAQKQG
jgi:FkbM family methyltransferase